MAEAGQVNTKLTIELAGGASSAGASQPSAPVARQSDIWRPGQAMSDYAAQRSANFKRIFAQELARDREAARELSLLRETNRVRFEAGEIASAVRSAEERIRRQESLARSVRANRGVLIDEFGEPGAIGRRAPRMAASASKRIMKGWGAGMVASFASAAALDAPEVGGAIGFLGRATLATVQGAAWAGAPGAVAGLMTASISEILKGLNATNKDVEELRKSMSEMRRNLDKAFKDAENEMTIIKGQLEQRLSQELDEIVHKALNHYRENRFQQSGLVN